MIADPLPHTARLRNLPHLDPRRTEASVGEHLAICDALLAFRTLAEAPSDGLELLG